MNEQGLNLYGTDLLGEPIEPPSKGILADRFLIPPFSVLNAREGWWQERKRAWVLLGIQSELGREGLGDTCAAQTVDYIAGRGGQGGGEAGSLFDPVICELIYRWFCPPDGQVLDPFAGGSVRGIVAAMLGMKYWGCDLSARQIEANEQQRVAICSNSALWWEHGDAIDLVPTAPLADLIFSCPPYGDLERYSDDPRDLSTMEYHTFVAALGRIVLRCHKQLRDNRFACFVVGEFRDKKGFYRNFVGDTTRLFLDAGFKYYNEAILVTSVGSLPIRASKQFSAGRKLGKTHQNILIFVKGDPKAATRAIIS